MRSQEARNEMAEQRKSFREIIRTAMSLIKKTSQKSMNTRKKENKKDVSTRKWNKKEKGLCKEKYYQFGGGNQGEKWIKKSMVK